MFPVVLCASSGTVRSPSLLIRVREARDAGAFVLGAVRGLLALALAFLDSGAQRGAVHITCSTPFSPIVS